MVHQETCQPTWSLGGHRPHQKENYLGWSAPAHEKLADSGNTAKVVSRQKNWRPAPLKSGSRWFTSQSVKGVDGKTWSIAEGHEGTHGHSVTFIITTYARAMRHPFSCTWLLVIADPCTSKSEKAKMLAERTLKKRHKLIKGKNIKDKQRMNAWHKLISCRKRFPKQRMNAWLFRTRTRYNARPLGAWSPEPFMEVGGCGMNLKNTVVHLTNCTGSVTDPNMVADARSFHIGHYVSKALQRSFGHAEDVEELHSFAS